MMKIFELRGKPLLAVIIITSSLDFMLFGVSQADMLMNSVP